MSVEQMKRTAAAKALEAVKSGMRVGLGTGSTADVFLQLLAARIGAGQLDVVGVATSRVTESRARELGIPLTTLDETSYLDLTVDGADEIDDELRLIKGGGGALLREKIVATSSERMVVIADETKKVPVLGRFPLPVEITPFGAGATRAMVEGLAGEAGCHGDVKLRRTPQGALFVTDGGNHILDCAFGRIDEPELLAEALQIIPGVVEHGLFLGLADVAVIGGTAGVRIMRLPDPEQADGKAN